MIQETERKKIDLQEIQIMKGEIDLFKEVR